MFAFYQDLKFVCLIYLPETHLSVTVIVDARCFLLAEMCVCVMQRDSRFSSLVTVAPTVLLADLGHAGAGGESGVVDLDNCVYSSGHSKEVYRLRSTPVSEWLQTEGSVWVFDYCSPSTLARSPSSPWRSPRAPRRLLHMEDGTAGNFCALQSVP